MIRLKEDINNLESKIKVLLFTHDPLLPLQFLAANRLLTIDAVNILEILQDDLEYEEDLIVLNKKKYYYLLSLCFDSGDIGTALEENEEVIELETLVEKSRISQHFHAVSRGHEKGSQGPISVTIDNIKCHKY